MPDQPIVFISHFAVRPGHADALRTMWRSVIGQLEAMMTRPDSRPTLETINVPTLVIVGDEDAVTPTKEARPMHAAIKGSRFEIIAQAGHLSNLERPAAFNTALSELLTALEAD